MLVIYFLKSEGLFEFCKLVLQYNLCLVIIFFEFFSFRYQYLYRVNSIVGFKRVLTYLINLKLRYLLFFLLDLGF